MPLFVKALGMQNCLGCHVEGNFKADTHNKRMAGAMWSHFVRALRTKTGAPDLPRAELTHCYLHGAAALRSDLTRVRRSRR